MKKQKEPKNNEITLSVPDIGEVVCVKSAKARNIRISLKPFGGVKVTVPMRESVQRAMDFVVQKTEWIRKARSEMQQRESAYTVFTPDTDFSTRQLRLRLFPWKSERFRVQTTKEQLLIFYPHAVDLLSANAQATIRAYVIERLRREAKEYLPLRTAQLAAEHGFSYKGVTVKHLTSRWGSCSRTNHINLSIHLVRLPEWLQDYVILHELAHTVHKNHGVDFWKCLDLHTGGKAKQLSADMRQYHTGWL
ncbi:MAG: M48 family metallopeptidase [Bacteroidales bacterium]|jgi:predicted metal-dependent hydrolase|nr:M48 family metallopeptidase [Bacteroidales bacterium]